MVFKYQLVNIETKTSSHTNVLVIALKLLSLDILAVTKKTY